MLLVDVHCHLDYFHNLTKIIEEAKKVGIKTIISNGINPHSNRATLDIAEKYDIVKASLGIHPTELDINIEAELDFIKKQKDKIIAIGEIGLDYTKDNNKKQKQVFQSLIELAERIQKPVIVHSRRAEQDCIETLESSKLRCILHCFSGNFKLVKYAVDLGYYFSIPTNITYSKHFQLLVEKVPINLLLTETDAPYLSPIKGEKNEPKNIIYVIKKIAQIKNLTEEETANNIFLNFNSLF